MVMANNTIKLILLIICIVVIVIESVVFAIKKYKLFAAVAVVFALVLIAFVIYLYVKQIQLRAIRKNNNSNNTINTKSTNMLLNILLFISVIVCIVFFVIFFVPSKKTSFDTSEEKEISNIIDCAEIEVTVRPIKTDEGGQPSGTKIFLTYFGYLCENFVTKYSDKSKTLTSVPELPTSAPKVLSFLTSSIDTFIKFLALQYETYSQFEDIQIVKDTHYTQLKHFIDFAKVESKNQFILFVIATFAAPIEVLLNTENPEKMTLHHYFSKKYDWETDIDKDETYRVLLTNYYLKNLIHDEEGKIAKMINCVENITANGWEMDKLETLKTLFEYIKIEKNKKE